MKVEFLENNLLRLPRAKTAILSFGTAVHEALERFSKMGEDYKVEIYGEGQERNKLEKLISALDLNSRILLMGRHNDIHERIKDASLYVLSSRYEGMPNALMEAMALGLPCIATNCSGGGPKTLITNRVNGILIKNDGEVALSKEIAFVLQNAQISKKLSNEATLVRNDFSIDIIGGLWLDYITKIIRSNQT